MIGQYIVVGGVGCLVLAAAVITVRSIVRGIQVLASIRELRDGRR